MHIQQLVTAAVISCLLSPVVFASATFTPSKTTKPVGLSLKDKIAAFSGKSTRTFTVQDLLKYSGLDVKGQKEYNEKGYQILAALKALLPPRARKSIVKGQTPEKRMTNAERLAKRLPLNPPMRRNPDAKKNLRRQASPGPPTTIDGRAGIEDENGDLVGYLSNQFLPSGQLSLSTEIGDSLTLTATYDSFQTTPSQVRVTITNPSIPAFPLLALVQGRDASEGDSDIGPGSSGYLYVAAAGGVGTPPGSTGSDIPNSFTDNTGIERLVQTDVWTLDLATGQLVAQWVNSDGTSVTGGLYIQDGVLYVLGDPAGFNAEYPEPIVPVTLPLLAIPP